MNRLKAIILSVALLGTVFAARAVGDWKVFPTFNDWTRMVVETPERVFFLTYAQPVSTYFENYKGEYSHLMMYEKEADELIPLTHRNYLSGLLVDKIAYNRSKGYLMVVYDDSNIDFIYDDGQYVNLPAIANSTINVSKKVNQITFDPEKDRAYLATDFGYIVVNDKKHEVASSLQTGFPLYGVARMGDRLVGIGEKNTITAPADKLVVTLDDLTYVEGMKAGKQIMPLSDDKFAFITTEASGAANMLCVATFETPGRVSVSDRQWQSYNECDSRDDGYFIDTDQGPYYLDLEGNLRALPCPPYSEKMQMTTVNMRDYWVVDGRKGLRKYRVGDSGDWTVTVDHRRPNLPSTFICEDIVYSPKYGMITASHGVSRNFSSLPQYPSSMSLYKNGEWTDYSLGTVNPAREGALRDGIGLAIDPTEPNRVLRSSRFDGLVSINLDDAADLMHLAASEHYDAGNPGFLTAFEPLPFSYFYGLSTPQFDAAGNLWLARCDNPDTGTGLMYFWPAADRKARNIKGLREMKLPINNVTHTVRIFPLKTSANKNLVIAYGGNKDGFSIIDHKGTPDNTADDVKAEMGASLFDQDGSKYEPNVIFKFVEDPATGTVWGLSEDGVFTFSPKQTFTNPNRVNRIKVARNDGTNLADMLLEGVKVVDLTIDGEGRKWFATVGGGLVCTSADGRTIHYQFNESNSYLPSNSVFAACYNPDNNSILVSTDRGMAEYFISGPQGSDTESAVKVYPNPVRPDYLGWITIEGLQEGSIVKIVDSMGGLVRELGPAEAGVVKWDATNMQHKRVGSGVYHVLSSSGPNEEKNLANVAKVLIIR